MSNIVKVGPNKFHIKYAYKYMTVGEIINLLQKFDKDTKVFTTMSFNGTFQEGTTRDIIDAIKLEDGIHLIRE